MASLWAVVYAFLFLRTVFGVALPATPPKQGLSESSAHKSLLPTEDPFYRAPAGFEDAKLGSILRQRLSPNNITLDNKNAVRVKNAWQILYRTQNSVREPSVSVVTVLEPFNAKKDHLLSYAMFSDSAFSGCNPSMTLQRGTRDDNQWNQIQTPILVMGLHLGYYVSVADYGGVQAAFSAGPTAGYSTLDSVRAVFSSSKLTGIDPNPITTLHGYSSGAQAIGWATELQPTYAPELKIAGAAFGGLVPNLSALLEMPAYQKGERAFLGPPVVLGLSHDYTNLSNWLEDNLIAGEKASVYRSSEVQCVTGNSVFANQDLGQFFKRGYNSVYDPVPSSVFRIAGTMGLTSTPKIPWYLYHAAGDDVSPQNLTDKIVDQHCKEGADILYEKNPLKLNHRYECAYGVTGAYRWMMDRHEGKPITKGCSTVRLSNESLRGVKENLLIQGLMANLWAYLGYDIGPMSSWQKHNRILANLPADG